MKTITTTFIAVITSMFFATSAIAGNCGGTPCITSADVIDGSILSKDLAPKTVSGVQIRNGAIFANKIAPGAVTPAKINATGAANGDVLTADGVGNASWQASGGGGGVSYLRTVVVSPVLNAGVPDPVASGTALIAALAGITGASATDPYLLKIEPGVYDLGLQSLTMKPYVDIEGSGEMSTTITSISGIGGTVNGASNAELRFVSVENIGGGAVAIYSNGVSPRLTHVTATASGGTNNTGILFINGPTLSPIITNVTAIASGAGTNNTGLSNDSLMAVTMINVIAMASGGTNNVGVSIVTVSLSTDSSLTNMTVTASGGIGSFNSGFLISNSSLILTNVTVRASGGGGATYGVYNSGTTSTVVIEHSAITATNSIYNANTSMVKIAASRLGGVTANPGGGTFTCVGAYNVSFVALTTACQ